MAEGWACDVATEAFEGVPLIGAALRVGMQAKTLGTDTALGLRHLWAGEAHRGLFPRQHFLPCSGAEGNAVGAGRRVQGRQGRIAIGVGQVGDSGGVFHERALPGQDLAEDGVRHEYCVSIP